MTLFQQTQHSFHYSNTYNSQYFLSINLTWYLTQNCLQPTVALTAHRMKHVSCSSTHRINSDFVKIMFYPFPLENNHGIIVFWVVTVHRTVSLFCFSGTCCIHLQAELILFSWTCWPSSPLNHFGTHLNKIKLLWNCRQHVLLKWWNKFIILYCGGSPNMIIWVTPTTKSWELTKTIELWRCQLRH
jgi:hypothetical protein